MTHRLTWRRVNQYAEASDQGHHVSASKGPDGWRFSAWSPPDKPELDYWKWLAQAPTKERYRQGEEVPQRVRLLGIFETAEEARAACESRAEFPEPTPS